jgi:hypothetical protein
MRLAAAIGAAQKGSLARICNLIFVCTRIFTMGAFPVAGVAALGSSMITILILGIVVAELGGRNTALTSAPTARGNREKPRPHGTKR